MNVSLNAKGHSLRLEVEEQPIGFDGHLRDSSAFRHEGNSRSERKENEGITEMSDRLALLGGTMEIRTQPGSGNRITVSLPLD
jgi:signal transduction histidine kinase